MDQEPCLFFDLRFFLVPSCVGQGQSGSPSVLSNASNRMQLNIFDLVRCELRIETFCNFNGHGGVFIFRILMKSWDLAHGTWMDVFSKETSAGLSGCWCACYFGAIQMLTSSYNIILLYWRQNHLNHLANHFLCHLMALARRRSKGTYGPLRRDFKRCLNLIKADQGFMNTFTFMTTCKRQLIYGVWWKSCGKAIFKMRIFLVTNPW